jgi:hypothetical protein
VYPVFLDEKQDSEDVALAVVFIFTIYDRLTHFKLGVYPSATFLVVSNLAGNIAFSLPRQDEILRAHFDGECLLPCASLGTEKTLATHPEFLHLILEGSLMIFEIVDGEDEFVYQPAFAVSTEIIDSCETKRF